MAGHLSQFDTHRLSEGGGEGVRQGGKREEGKGEGGRSEVRREGGRGELHCT